jgi:chromosome segregation ATPase
VDDGKAPPKRRKKKANSQPEVIVEETEQIIEEVHQEHTHSQDEDMGEQPEAEPVEVLRSSQKHVHFGSDVENVDPELPTAHHITPYPQKKMTVKRRTLSQNFGTEVKRVKETRTSLPSSLSHDGIAHPNEVTYNNFRSLRDVLQAAKQRLSQLTSGKANNVDEDAMDVVDDDFEVLESREQHEVPQQESLASTALAISKRISDSGAAASAQGSVAKARAMWDEERIRFHDAILALEKEAKDAKAQLTILSIEAESLGFEDGEDAVTVLKSIRAAFDNARETLEIELPGTVPDDAENQDILEIVLANMKEFADRLRTAHKELFDKSTLSAKLGTQVNNLVDRLAAGQLRYEQLHEKWTLLDEANETQANELSELRDAIAAAEKERDELQEAYDAEIEKNNDFSDDVSRLEKDVERLNASLEGYQSEERRLTELVEKMENEHRNTVTAMNQERETTVREIEGNLDAETERRGEAEALAEERQSTIDELQAKLQEAQRGHDTLFEERNSLQAELDEETKEHEGTQAELAEKQADIADLEGRIAKVEEEAAELEEQLATLREQLQTEREQREAAEEEVDRQNEEIEKLNEKLRTQGKETNELRLKAHDLQTKNQQRIKELEERMSERDLQFQSDMAEEVKRREDAEELAQKRADELQQVQDRLAAVETQMRELLAEREARIEELEEELAQKEAEIEDLNDDLQTAKDTHKQELQQRDARNVQLEDAIAALQTTIADHEERIRDLQQEAVDATSMHDSQVEDRDAAIQDLNHRVVELEAIKKELEEDKASLERRVEAEAEQMLQSSFNHSNQVDDLERQLKVKQALIDEAKDRVEEVKELSDRTIKTQKAQVEELQISVSAKDETIANMAKAHEKLSKKFRAYVRRSTDAMDAIQRAQRAMVAAADLEADDFGKESEQVLAELDDLPVPQHEPVSRSEMVEVKQKKIKGRGRKVRDSGLGLEDDSVMLE